jgi:hypothetical protein
MSINLGSQRLIDEDGTVVLPDGSTAEEDLLIIEAYGATFSLTAVNLDLSNLTQNATFRVYYKIDGTNYRRRFGTGVAGGVISWTTADGPWLALSLNGVWDHDIKITIQSAGEEAAPRDVIYSYVGAR